MIPQDDARPPPLADNGAFPATQWSVVLAAGHPNSLATTGALEKLCRADWDPLHVFLRRQGHSAEDAQDLVQEFFARLLAKDYIARGKPHEGKFRSFLLAGLDRLLCDERDKANRLKRGGGEAIISLDAQAAEDR
jgi:RNA polymerase sigma-70 factor (ECF subfamily)